MTPTTKARTKFYVILCMAYLPQLVSGYEIWRRFLSINRSYAQRDDRNYCHGLCKLSHVCRFFRLFSIGADGDFSDTIVQSQL